MEESASVVEVGKVLSRDYIEVINLLLDVIRLANKMWDTMDEEMFRHHPNITISNDIL